MKFKYNIFLMALSVFSLWFVSCDEYRDADELDDQLYLQKSGLLEAKVFNWGTFTYELPVIKSGKGNIPQPSACRWMNPFWLLITKRTVPIIN